MNIEDIDSEILELENLAESTVSYCSRRIRSLKATRRHAMAKIFGEVHGEPPTIVDNVSKAYKPRDSKNCSCYFLKGQLQVNPRCKEHGVKIR